MTTNDTAPSGLVPVKARYVAAAEVMILASAKLASAVAEAVGPDENNVPANVLVHRNVSAALDDFHATVRRLRQAIEDSGLDGSVVLSPVNEADALRLVQAVAIAISPKEIKAVYRLNRRVRDVDPSSDMPPVPRSVVEAVRGTAAEIVDWLLWLARNPIPAEGDTPVVGPAPGA